MCPPRPSLSSCSRRRGSAHSPAYAVQAPPSWLIAACIRLLRWDASLPLSAGSVGLRRSAPGAFPSPWCRSCSHQSSSLWSVPPAREAFPPRTEPSAFCKGRFPCIVGCISSSTSSRAARSAACTVLTSQLGQPWRCSPIPRSSRRMLLARLERLALARLEVKIPRLAAMTSAGCETVPPSRTAWSMMAISASVCQCSFAAPCWSPYRAPARAGMDSVTA